MLCGFDFAAKKSDEKAASKKVVFMSETCGNSLDKNSFTRV